MKVCVKNLLILLFSIGSGQLCAMVPNVPIVTDAKSKVGSTVEPVVASAPLRQPTAQEQAQAVLKATQLRAQGAQEIAKRKDANLPFDKASLESVLGVTLSQAQYDSMVTEEQTTRKVSDAIKTKVQEHNAIERLNQQLLTETIKRGFKWTNDSMTQWVKTNYPLFSAESVQSILYVLLNEAQNPWQKNALELQNTLVKDFAKKRNIDENTAKDVLLEAIVRINKKFGGSRDVIIRTIFDVYDKTDQGIENYLQ